MKFPCPSCRKVIEANPPSKPGRFAPKCPLCRAAFVIAVTVSSLAEAEARERSLAARTDPNLTRPTVPERSTVRRPNADPNLTRPSRPAGAPVAAAGSFSDESIAAALQGASSEAEAEPPAAIPGYELVKQLGRGGMGTVYLACQLSLDRSVAVKVVNPDWARDPVFIARFVREAYAAAQLAHHNVVQIYDLGRHADLNYFSMELVDGRSLGDLLRDGGPLPPEVAVGYTVQAARGLKFAHDRGMVHRDVKPDNLLVNGEGVVKVSDLGLVKTRDLTAEDDRGPAGGPRGKVGSGLRSVSDITEAGSMMGSPLYMAPEQGRDATAVDHRADVYSLGCTLYALLAGRAPFHGSSVIELMTQHLQAAPPPLHQVAPAVASDLGRIVEKSLAKQPAARFQSMDELIRALNQWQQARGLGPGRPTEDQLAAFEKLVRNLGRAPTAQPARLVGLFGPLAGVLAAALALPVNAVAAGGILVGTAAATLAGFITSGLLTRSPLFAKAREWAFGARLVDWLTAIGAVLLFAAGLYFAGLHKVAVLAVAVGAGAGVAYGYVLAKPTHDHEQQIKDGLDGVCRRLRLGGLDEDGVRQFVVEQAGDRWEHVYELLYGYPAKVQARGLYADQVASRPKHAGWRDAAVGRIEAAVEARKQVRAKAMLKKLEAERLKAEGVEVTEAMLLAEDVADDLVGQGQQIRAANADTRRRVNVREAMARYSRGEVTRRPRPSPLVRLLTAVLAVPFDPRLRVLVGAALIVGALMWCKQNVEAAAAPAVGGDDPAAELVATKARGLWDSLQPLLLEPKPDKALQVSWLPTTVSGLFDSINPLIAGVLLLLSAASSRRWAILTATLGAMIAFVGHKVGVPIPEGVPLTPSHLTGLVGLTIGLLGLFLLGRR